MLEIRNSDAKHGKAQLGKELAEDLLWLYGSPVHFL